MARFKEELTETWVSILEAISLVEFCERWVPVIYRVGVKESLKYRKASTDLLMRVTRVSKKSVQNWLSGTQPCPCDTLHYLGVVDKLWQIRYQILPIIMKK
jgi:hypothetical protein